jgi:hypothetical protein
MMAGDPSTMLRTLKLVHKRSNITAQGSVSFPTLRRGLRCRNKSFNDFIQHQIQALIYAPLFIVFNGRHAFAALRFWSFFIKEKGLAPAAMSRDKPVLSAKY